MADGKAKNENRWLVVAVCVLGVVILILGVIDVWLISGGSGVIAAAREERIREELVSSEVYNKVSLYSFEGEVEGYDEYVGYLEGIMNSSTDLDNAMTARRYLVTINIYNHRYDEASRLLDEGLKDARLDDQNKYWLLGQYMWLYIESDDLNGQIRVLEELVKLPDDLKVEGASWSQEKPVRIKELEEKRRKIEGIEAEDAVQNIEQVVEVDYEE